MGGGGGPIILIALKRFEIGQQYNSKLVIFLKALKRTRQKSTLKPLIFATTAVTSGLVQNDFKGCI